MRKAKRGSAPSTDAVGVEWTGVTIDRTEYPGGTTIFAQGEAAQSVLFVEQGNVRLSVVSLGGKEAVIAILEPQNFFGEGCLAGQPRRMATATALNACRIVTVDKAEMQRQLKARAAFSHRFLAHMLTRNIRIEEDLIDQLFNSSEKRLARTLLLLARYGEEQTSPHVLPKLSQELLAEMVGTTRSRVNFFMNKFRKLGFIEYNGGLKIHSSLLSVVLHE